MLKVTLWRPDTCSCVVEYEWDDAVKEDARVHSFKRFAARCPAHASDQNMDGCLERNRRKNRLLDLAVENIAELAETKLTDNGVFVKSLKPGVSFDWSFDPLGDLNVSFSGITPPQSQRLKVLSDSMFGAGRVKIMP